MANREKGEVDLEIGGQRYTLALPTNAIVELETLLSTKETRARVPEVVYEVAMGNITYTRAFLWAALRKHHKAITLEGAGDLLDVVGGTEQLFAAIQALHASTRPDPEDQTTVDQGRPQAPRSIPGIGAAATSTPDASA